MLAQQRQATQEIAQNVQGIAEKATKTYGEIASITERLIKAEAMAQKALDAAEETAPAYSLVRLVGDVGAWKRRLANVLLGQATPDKRAASLRNETSAALAPACGIRIRAASRLRTPRSGGAGRQHGGRPSG